jgi:hypothetical protein
MPQRAHDELRAVAPRCAPRLKQQGCIRNAISRREGIGRLRLDLKEKGQLTKGPQASSFARAYASVVGIAEEVGMEQLFIPRPDVKTGGKGHKRQKAPEESGG